MSFLMPPPLLNDHDGYKHISPADRKRLISSFQVFLRHMPAHCTCITLRRKEYSDFGKMATAMQKCLINFLFDDLPHFQNFDTAKTYYGDGQKSGTRVIRKGVDCAFSKDAATYRLASPSGFRPHQIADYACAMAGFLQVCQQESIATDEKFFGS